MQYRQAFIDRCTLRGLDGAQLETALAFVAGLDQWLAERNRSIDKASLPEVDEYTDTLVNNVPDAASFILALARYFAVSAQDDLVIRLLARLLPIGVLPAMAERLERLEGTAIRERVMQDVAIPSPGSLPQAYPEATRRFVSQLEATIGHERSLRVLTWNVHGIPAQAHATERDRLLELGSVGAWLSDHHRRQVEILQRHADDHSLWFEQKITPAVVAMVAGNQELLTGVRHGRTIYQTKIPYNPDALLGSADRTEKRRLACHCPLAASTISDTGAKVPGIWCACSAGYQKFMFDVAFGTETQARVLRSVLEGDDLCRFAIEIPDTLTVPLQSTNTAPN